MTTIKEQLENLYLNTLGESFELCIPIREKILRRPLLIKFANDNAIKNEANLRVMFFMQETNDWCEDGKTDEVMKTYRKFFNDFDEYSQNPPHPYWKTQKYTWLVLEEMKNTINRRVSGVSYIWNNIVKAEYNIGKYPKVPYDVYTEFRDVNRKLILAEIEIIKPDVLVFFTGPSYNKKLDDVFNESKEIDKKKIDIGGNMNALKIMELPLPLSGSAYITYHPLYLGRNVKPLKAPILNVIAEQCAAVALAKERAQK